MKDFLKFTLATITGIIVSSVLLFIVSILVMFSMLYSSDSEVIVRENSILKLNLNGALVERSEEDPLSLLWGDETAVYGLDDLLASIRKAKENDNIKGIYIEATSLIADGFASLKEVRDALADFKESGKFIVAYGDMYTQPMYYVASVADRVLLNPQGMLEWSGLSSMPVFYKDLMDKLGIRWQIFKVGTYKSAVEPFIGMEMSEANREQTTDYLTSLWGEMTAEVAASRGVTVDDLNRAADRMLLFQPAAECVQAGLADTLIYKNDVRDYLKQWVGIDKDDDLRTLGLKDMKNVKKNVPKDKSGNIVAVYYADGMIGSLMAGGSGQGIDGNQMIRDLRGLKEDEDVKAVVLRINSPGGSAYDSEQIWHAVGELKKEKPVIVSMGDYAASGGYYIACAADWIIAQPTTLTGSIGIFGYIPNAEKLLNDKLGIHFDGVKTNKLSDLGDISRPFTEEETALMQNMVNHGYELFTQRCADGRKMPVDEIKRIAEGRVWTGKMAKDLKLVDELGGIDRAIAVAAERAEIENYTVMSYPKQEDFFSSLLSSGTDRYLSARLKAELGALYEPFRYLQTIKESDRIQARLPFMITIK